MKEDTFLRRLSRSGCHNNVAIQEVLRDYSCLTYNFADLEFRPVTYKAPDDYLIQTMQVIENTARYDILADQVLWHELTVTGEFWACPFPYIALRLVTPMHVAVAIIHKNLNNFVEVFDSNGSGDSSIQFIYTMLVRKVVPEDAEIIFVNDKNLQEESWSCQTWVNYYLYLRFVKGYEIRKIINNLQALTRTEQFDEIQRFYHFSSTMTRDNAQEFEMSVKVPDCVIT